MTELKLTTGQRVSFKRPYGDTIFTGTITETDYEDPSVPYYVDVPEVGGFWITDNEIIEVFGNVNFELINAKLDAIIRHFGVPFEL